MKVLVVDDENLARSRIIKQLKRYDDSYEIYDTDNGKDAVDLINREKFDLLFLDVLMREMTGFEILKRIDDYPVTIFVTAYDEYAVKAFEVNAIDYLLKPFSSERFAEAMDRVLKIIQLGKNTQKNISSLIDYHDGKNVYLERLTIKEKYDYRIIDVMMINYFTVENSILYLCTDSGRYEIDTSLSKLEENLNPKDFFRAHRKTIVNISRIIKIIPWGKSRYAINFSDNESIQLSREKTQEFKTRVGLKI